MRTGKSSTVTLRLDSYMREYLRRIEGDNDAEKIRHLIRFGIAQDKRLRRNLLLVNDNSFTEENKNEA